MKQYNPKLIEGKWQKLWAKQGIYAARDKGKKKFVLIEFPYPSGEGLHMGHLRPYVAGDVYSRFQRMKGFETMYPMGWDAFGLPAENYALKKGVHPSVSTKLNIKNAKRQVQSWGVGFDWSREINTTDPEYYKWTQWIFLQFYKAGLAYEAAGLINWCPQDKTGLANEEVIDGKCERCGTVVEKKELRQWYLKITAYAEKLLEGLKNLPEWPDQVKLQQENWIGKSEGAEIDFPLFVIPAAEPESSPPQADGSRRPKSGMTNFLILHGYTGSAGRNFIPWLKTELEKQGYKVQTPELPNSDDPKESEQVDYILKKCSIDENTIIVGHSLGCIVAMKALQKYGKSVKGLILLDAAVDPAFSGATPRPFHKNFSWNFDYERLKKYAPARTILSDLKEGEPRVGYLKTLSKKLDAQLITGRSTENHFTAEREPLVLEILTPPSIPPHQGEGRGEGIKIFTTRVDTLPGATFIVIAPEHPLIQNFASRISNFSEVSKYIEEAKKKTDIVRSARDKEKTGVELKGVKVVNPVNGEKLPIWVADYALMDFGTGALFGDAHDERDQAFAKKYKIPLKVTLKPANGRDDSKIRNLEEVFIDDGVLYNSGEFDGLSSEEARKVITKWLVDKKSGRATVSYKLRDWVFSRQRYWGEPIPIIHCPACGIVPVPEKDLPVRLPNVKKYEPTGTGESPLAAIDKWVKVKCPNCKGPAKRETNTMPQWAGSSWYYLRYTDPKNKNELADDELMKHWLPVDVYFGGTEHTTLHLLYSRFWNLFLHDQGIVPVSEPYTKRVPHGIILAEDGEKMSKSRGNVVNPDEIVNIYGADTLRMYELFLGPHGQTVSWHSRGIIGVRRFLEKVWRLASIKESSTSRIQSDKLESIIHKTIKKVTDDIENFRFNTAVSALMILANEMEGKQVSKNDITRLLKLLAPFAPHMAEDLWRELGNKVSIHLAQWPEHDPALAKDEFVNVAVQINGRVRDTVRIAVAASEAEARNFAEASSQVQKHLVGKQVGKFIYIPGKIINFVVK